MQKICLLGIRLGALLAALAANDCDDLVCLIMIAPVLSGTRYVKALRTSQLAASMLHPGSEALTEEGEDGIEVSGFVLSRETVKTLESIELSEHRLPSAMSVLAIDGTGFPSSEKCVEQMCGASVRRECLRLPGLVEMVMTAPQFASSSQEMMLKTRQWLAWLSAPGPMGATRQGAIARSSIELNKFPGETLETDSLTERPVFIDSDVPLFGIVTEPAPSELRRRAVILLNAGADPHIGANGMYVDLARYWASRGYVALRMDLAGIGDSGTRPGQREDNVFPVDFFQDVRAAWEFLRRRYGAEDISLFGLCSGAYHALRAAVAGLQVTRLLMVNPQNYFWREGMSLNDLQPAEVVRNPSIYRRQVLSVSAWRRLISGQVNLWRIARIYFHRPLLALESTLRDMARRLHLPLPNDLGKDLEEIAARNIRIVFVFARDEPGIDLLKLEAGSIVSKLGARCRVHVVDGGDHIFTRSGPRAVMKQLLSDELFARSSARRGELVRA